MQLFTDKITFLMTIFLLITIDARRKDIVIIGKSLSGPISRPQSKSIKKLYIFLLRNGI